MHVVLVAKSAWEPSIRREHALARAAAAHDVRCTFVEAPADVRSARTRPAGWARDLLVPRVSAPAGTVLARSTVVPGHRSSWARAADVALLRRTLERRAAVDPFDVAVVQAPWQWDATAGLGVPRVFDAADDWTALVPARAAAITMLYRRIAAEADLVVLAQDGLAGLLPGARTVTVPNGVDAALCAARPAPRPGRRALGYVGTLSERFDAGFVGELLDLLPDWTLDLHGPCRYGGSGERPGRDLAALLDRLPERVTWHGALPRQRVAAAIDAADVLLVPNRPDRGAGQSSMKLLDYAARGRPVLTTSWDPALAEQLPPGSAVADDAEQAAAAVRRLAGEPGSVAAERVSWALERTWDTRAAAWYGEVSAAAGTAFALPGVAR